VRPPLRPAHSWWPLAVGLGLAGCVGWRSYEPAAPLSNSTGLPYRLRATLTDSRRVELTSPFVRADTLYGRSGPHRDTVALALPTIRGLERERLSAWRTLGVVVAPVAVLFAVFAIGCGVEDCGAEPTH
jgi:hypothetical protein